MEGERRGAAGGVRVIRVGLMWVAAALGKQPPRRQPSGTAGPGSRASPGPAAPSASASNCLRRTTTTTNTTTNNNNNKRHQPSPPAPPSSGPPPCAPAPGSPSQTPGCPRWARSRSAQPAARCRGRGGGWGRRRKVGEASAATGGERQAVGCLACNMQEVERHTAGGSRPALPRSSPPPARLRPRPPSQRAHLSRSSAVLYRSSSPRVTPNRCRRRTSCTATSTAPRQSLGSDVMVRVDTAHPSRPLSLMSSSANSVGGRRGGEEGWG